MVLASFVPGRRPDGYRLFDAILGTLSLSHRFQVTLFSPSPGANVQLAMQPFAEEQTAAGAQCQNQRNRASADPIARAALRQGTPLKTVIRRATSAVEWQSEPGPREASRKNRLDLRTA